MVSHPPYTVAPPDVLLLNVLRAVPKGPYRLEPLKALQIAVTNTLPNQAISGTYVISPEGYINLGFTYGNVHVGGLQLDEAEAAIRKHLSSIVRDPNVTLGLIQFRGMEQIRGEHLVRPDGTSTSELRPGLRCRPLAWPSQVRDREASGEYLVNPQISVDVFAYNSRVYYIIVDGGGFGQRSSSLPHTGNETVLDAISNVQRLGPGVVDAPHLLGPAFAGEPRVQSGVAGRLASHHARRLDGDQLPDLPRRPHLRRSNWLIRLDNRMAQVLAPVDRILGITLLARPRSTASVARTAAAASSWSSA